MRKKPKKITGNKEAKKSIFTDLDKNIKRENQVYVNEEILEAVIDAKKKTAEQKTEDLDNRDNISIPSTVDRAALIAEENIPNAQEPKDKIVPEDNLVEGEPHSDDLDIYDSLFSETTIVSTQIYTYDIDKSLGENNYSSSCTYRVGQDTTDMGTIFTVTKKNLDKPINVSHPHKNSDLSWYNDLAGLGFSYAAVCGTTVQGIIICEPQYWNDTLYVRHLMVGKKYRLNGIGKKLIEECVHRAWAEGFRALALEVNSSNGSAIDFYRHLHFNIVGLNVGLYSNSDILKEDVGIFMHRLIV